MEPEQLPVSVSGPSEVGRLLHELEAIDSALLSQELREGQTATAPTMSGLMRSTVEANKFNLSHKEDRDRLGQFLRHVKQNAPLLHISFSADPPPNFMERLMTWLRREIDPHV